jgi:processing peptidase subunit alpha
MESIALGSTTTKSEFRRVRDTFANGSSTGVRASRHHLSFTAESLLGPSGHELDPTEFIVNQFADCLQNPAFLPEEVARAKEDTKEAITLLSEQPDNQINELIHAAAYSQNTLGLPLYGNPATIDSFTPEVLREYAQTFFIPSRLVVAAVGVKHEDFVGVVEKAFRDMPTGTPFETQAAQYTGGDLRVDMRGQTMAQVAIAFETASWNDPDLVPMCVLQMMMGGGDSFSAGGPGKGMHSRLYTNVLNQYGWVESANSFNSLHSDSSIFGLQGSAPAANGKDLTAVLIDQARKMASAPTEIELGRAKNSLKSAVFMQLEERQQQLDDIGSQVLFGTFLTPVELGLRIDAVTGSDIQRVATKMLKTPVSVAARGNLAMVPSIDTIRQAMSS